MINPMRKSPVIKRRVSEAFKALSSFEAEKEDRKKLWNNEDKGLVLIVLVVWLTALMNRFGVVINRGNQI